MFSKGISHRPIDIKGPFKETLTDNNVSLMQKNYQLSRIIERNNYSSENEEQER